MAESEGEDPATAYRRRQFDEPWDFIISGILPEGNSGLIFGWNEFETWLRSEFEVLRYEVMTPEQTTQPHVEFNLSTPLNPLDVEVNGSAFFSDGQINLEPVTPRFVFRFLTSFVKRFPRNNQIFTIMNTITHARFDPSMDEENAMLNMMTDDMELMDELGTYFGEKIQP